MLTQTLRSLERDGLVSRRAYATVPVTVEYALTPLGETLVEVLAAFATGPRRTQGRSSWHVSASTASAK
jgi:DNA-binding HxlR family transcriptional regulator